MAASTLTDDQVKQVIRCYAYESSPAEARAKTGLSHVTIYRLYGYIRQRLLDVGLYRTKIAFIDDMNEAEEEGREHFDWEPFEARLRRWIGARRGIDRDNRDVYLAEAVFWVQDNRFTPRQFYGLILQALKDTGPLNRPPRHLQPRSIWNACVSITRCCGTLFAATRSPRRASKISCWQEPIIWRKSRPGFSVI